MAFVLNFLKARRQKRVQIIPRDPCRLSPEEWRADPNMVKIAQQILNDDRFRLMLDCVYFASPGNYIIGKTTLEDRALIQAQTQGYAIALSCLRSLGTHSRPAEDLGDPTFEAPEELTPDGSLSPAQTK